MARAVTSDPQRRAAGEPLYDIDPRPSARAALGGFGGLASAASCRTGRRATRLHATLLGHALGHDMAVIKKLCNIRLLCVELADAVSAQSSANGLIFVRYTQTH
jgi:hypothetical protein